MGHLSTVFIDVGGVLWHFNDEATAHALRIERLAAACGLTDTAARELLAEIESRIVEPSGLDRFDVLVEIRNALHEIGCPYDVPTIRRALCVPAGAWIDHDPGMRDFLTRLGSAGLRRVIVSNVIWRSAEDYWRDFAMYGVADQIDGIVSSLDALVRKPNPLIFQIALATAGDPLPSSCVMIGDTEEKDIAPARALGMHTILMGGDGSRSAANAVVTSLEAAATTILLWNDEPPAQDVGASAAETEPGLAIP